MCIPIFIGNVRVSAAADFDLNTHAHTLIPVNNILMCLLTCQFRDRTRADFKLCGMKGPLRCHFIASH